MACIRNGDNHTAVPKQKGLAFSIDKIIGIQSDSKQCSSDNHSDNVISDENDDIELLDKVTAPKSEHSSHLDDEMTKPFNANSKTEHDAKENSVTNKRKNYETENTHVNAETRGLSPIKAAAIMHDPDLQSKFKQVYQAGEFQDLNMNVMSYLHPAFLLGRMNQEDYRTHVLQNYYLNQNAHVGREPSYALDLYKIASSQYFNSPVSLNLKKQYQFEGLKVNEPIQPHIDELESKHKFTVPGTDLSINKLNNLKESDHNAIRDFKDGNQEVREKKLPSNQTKLPGNQNRNQKTFTCPECGKIFNAHYNLTRHMPVHTGELTLQTNVKIKRLHN